MNMAIQNTPANTSFWADRFKASGIHLGLRLVVASLPTLIVFGIWYAHAYREISGACSVFCCQLRRAASCGQ